eukprot:3483106-Ditylum_brightwellii.AAC.1
MDNSTSHKDDRSSSELLSASSDVSNMNKGSQTKNSSDIKDEVADDESRIDDTEANIFREKMERNMTRTTEENDHPSIPSINHTMSDLSISSSIACIVERAKKRQSQKIVRGSDIFRGKEVAVDSSHDVLARIKEKRMSMHSHFSQIDNAKKSESFTRARQLSYNSRLLGNNNVVTKAQERRVPPSISINERFVDNGSDDIS